MCMEASPDINLTSGGILLWRPNHSYTTWRITYRHKDLLRINSLRFLDFLHLGQCPHRCGWLLKDNDTSHLDIGWWICSGLKNAFNERNHYYHFLVKSKGNVYFLKTCNFDVLMILHYLKSIIIKNMSYILHEFSKD